MLTRFDNKLKNLFYRPAAFHFSTAIRAKKKNQHILGCNGTKNPHLRLSPAANRSVDDDDAVTARLSSLLHSETRPFILVRCGTYGQCEKRLSGLSPITLDESVAAGGLYFTCWPCCCCRWKGHYTYQVGTSNNFSSIQHAPAEQQHGPACIASVKVGAGKDM